MSSFFTNTDLVLSPIQEGDAGIVLKPDGSFQVFTTGQIDPKNLTEAQIQQGEKLVALSLALKIPAVMDILVQMVNDPAITSNPIEVEVKH